VVGKIVPEIDMPFDENGQTIDIIFNPLSVPSRMNIGQLVEVFLGLVAHQTKTKLLVRPFNTPDWEQIIQIAQESGVKDYGLTQLYDGQTGLPFDQKILVGYIYTIKLNHMVADKFHVRNVGPYALVHQQPVKGRAHGGGQRVGEMEAWALEAHGAAYNLLEMTGAKSDDLHLRKMIQYSLIFGERELIIKNNQSESFNLLLQYLRVLGFDLTAEDYQGKNIDFYKQFSRIFTT
jgi:DNA-directed RNA polymerase subunit beta